MNKVALPRYPQSGMAIILDDREVEALKLAIAQYKAAMPYRSDWAESVFIAMDYALDHFLPPYGDNR